MIDAPLTDNEREMLEKLMAGIRERFGDLLIEARLFGSKARGDSDPESDIDVWLLFERELTREEYDSLSRLSTHLDIEHGTVTQLLLHSRERWLEPWRELTGVYRSLQTEGVPL